MRKIYELLDTLKIRLPHLKIDFKEDNKGTRFDITAITYYDTFPITEYRETVVGEIESVYERLYHNILSHLLFNSIMETIKTLNIDVEGINKRKADEAHEQWLKDCAKFDMETKVKLGMADSSSTFTPRAL